MGRKVFIQSIPRESALGINKWVDPKSGISLNKTKMSRCTDKMVALPNLKVGGLANYISYNFHMNPETGTPYKDDKGNDITLQAYLEKKWFKPEGYYSNRAWMKGDSLDESKMTYFQKKYWQLVDGTTVLDLDSEDDEMFYYVCLGSQRIANSEREWRAHKWAKATHFIAQENEGDEIKYKRNEVKSKAFAALHDPNLTDITKRKIVSLLDISSTKAHLTTEQVANLLFDYIDKSTYLADSNINKFHNIVNLLNTPKGLDEFDAQWIIKQAIDNRIIYEKQGTYTWIRPKGSLVIGERLPEAIDFILNPKKSVEIDELKAEIKAKTV